jgi:hypothetical protein
VIDRLAYVTNWSSVLLTLHTNLHYQTVEEQVNTGLIIMEYIPYTTLVSDPTVYQTCPESPAGLTHHNFQLCLPCQTPVQNNTPKVSFMPLKSLSHLMLHVYTAAVVWTLLWSLLV